MRITQNMLFSSSADWQPGLSCELLIGQRWERVETLAGDRLHSHHFSQIELVLEGTIDLKGEVECELPPGAAVYIPPDTEHGFAYPNGMAEWVTLKFVVEPQDPVQSTTVIQPGTTATPMFTQLAQLVEMDAHSHYQTRPLIEMSLTLIVQELSHTHGILHSESGDVADQAMRYVRRRNGRSVTIEEIAAHLDVSVSHLSRRFKEQQGISLKTFIDELRVEIAKDLIIYSRQPLAEIAETLDFSDAFAFSRFMKRKLGFPPSQLRR